MTDVESQKLFSLLLAAFPMQMRGLSSEQVKQTAAMYRRCLADLDASKASEVVTRICSDSEFFPTIATIRKAYAAATGIKRKTGAEAWGEVLAAVSRFGVYRVPGVDFSFDDENTARCVRALGWKNLCESENATADRARFVDAYDRMSEDTHRDRVAGQHGPRLEAPRNESARALTVGEALLARFGGGR